LLEQASLGGAPIAARAAVCGYWDGYYWQTKVVKAGVRLNGSSEEVQALADRFAEAFNAALDSSEVSELHCSAAQQLALDRLVLIDQIGD
jgi:hypothetical protein